MSADRVALLCEAVEGREVVVHLSRALERRLRAGVERFNGESPYDPMDADSDADLAVGLLASADHGLRCAESEYGVWSDMGGHLHALPRARRARWWRRLSWAWHAALVEWRSG